MQWPPGADAGRAGTVGAEVVARMLAGTGPAVARAHPSVPCVLVPVDISRCRPGPRSAHALPEWPCHAQRQLRSPRAFPTCPRLFSRRPLVSLSVAQTNLLVPLPLPVLP